MNRLFVILEDGSTFSPADGCLLVWLSHDSLTTLEDNDDDITTVDLDAKGNLSIPIEDLIEAYNEVHGTDI